METIKNKYQAIQQPTNKMKIYSLAALSILISGPVYATVELSLSTAYLDNPTYSSDSDASSNDSDVLTRASLLLSFDRETQKFRTLIDYDLEYEKYKNGSFDDVDRASGSGSLTWNIVPDLFSWDISNIRNVQKIDFVEANTVENQQVVSVTSTGPNFEFAISGNNLINVELDYEIAEYGESSLGDQDRKRAYIDYNRVINDGLFFTASASYLEVGFDKNDILNYVSSNISASVNYITSRYEVTLEAGETHIERDVSPNRYDRNYGFSASYTPNTKSTLSFSYSESIEDTFSLLISSNQVITNTSFFNQNGQQTGVGLTSNDFDFFLIKRKTLSYGYISDNQINFNVTYDNDERESESFNNAQSSESIRFNLIFPFGTRFDFDLYALYAELDFEALSSKQKQVQLGASATYQLNSRFKLETSLVHSDQRSNIELNSYDSWQVYIGLVITLQ